MTSKCWEVHEQHYLHKLYSVNCKPSLEGNTLSFEVLMQYMWHCLCEGQCPKALYKVPECLWCTFF